MLRGEDEDEDEDEERALAAWFRTRESGRGGGRKREPSGLPEALERLNRKSAPFSGILKVQR